MKLWKKLIAPVLAAALAAPLLLGAASTALEPTTTTMDGSLFCLTYEWPETDAVDPATLVQEQTTYQGMTYTYFDQKIERIEGVVLEKEVTERRESLSDSEDIERILSCQPKTLFYSQDGYEGTLIRDDSSLTLTLKEPPTPVEQTSVVLLSEPGADEIVPSDAQIEPTVSEVEEKPIYRVTLTYRGTVTKQEPSWMRATLRYQPKAAEPVESSTQQVLRALFPQWETYAPYLPMAAAGLVGFVVLLLLMKTFAKRCKKRRKAKKETQAKQTKEQPHSAPMPQFFSYMERSGEDTMQE